jgi:hypothetical protein
VWYIIEHTTIPFSTIHLDLQVFLFVHCVWKTWATAFLGTTNQTYIASRIHHPQQKLFKLYLSLTMVDVLVVTCVLSSLLHHYKYLVDSSCLRINYHSLISRCGAMSSARKTRSKPSRTFHKSLSLGATPSTLFSSGFPDSKKRSTTQDPNHSDGCCLFHPQKGCLLPSFPSS